MFQISIIFIDKEAKEKEKAAQQLAVPRLSVCADAQKVDRAKLAQTEVNINKLIYIYIYWWTCNLAALSANITAVNYICYKIIS